VAVDGDGTAVASQAVVGHGAGLAESPSPTAMMTTVSPYARCRFFDGEGVKRAGKRGEVAKCDSTADVPYFASSEEHSLCQYIQYCISIYSTYLGTYDVHSKHVGL
jgi:hypothetical protein